eukprot:CAMPEP_0196667902 /NCGR_PEP_ID=MMETSP1086-20130531/65333_1 /TAXON_ID=77921 /ORGANISM="Cyanoptyche  gloeocystis , Strain SAG4.97" /LENGTH=296 /DNA_ID=CAMNT_0042005267 /DNA_START=238 /DNA_END=1127 /DNA_ORIENTATION=+
MSLSSPSSHAASSELPSDDLPDSDTSLLQGLRLEVLKRGLAAPVLGSVPHLPAITFSEIHMAFSKYDGNQLAAKLNILFALGRENFDEKAALLTLLQRPNCLAAVSRRIDISPDVNLDRGNVLDQWDARELSLNTFFRSLADKRFAEFVETSESELAQLMVPHALASGFLSGLSHYDNLKGVTVVSVIVATHTAADGMFGTSSFGILSESESDRLDESDAGAGPTSESDWDRRLNQRLTWLGDVAGDSRFLPGFAMYWTTDSDEDAQEMFQGDGKLQGKRHVVWRTNQVPKKVPRN